MGNVSTLNPHGFFTFTNPYGDLQEGETLQCVHCGGHWAIQRGSGKERGFCMRCNGFHCGGPACRECRPLEAGLEIIEGTRNPTAVSVGVLWVPPGT